jgi:hypothetical protein
MAEHHDPLPQNEEGLLDFGENFTSQVVTNAETLQVPAKEATDVQAAFNAFKTLHAQAKGPTGNPIITTEKNAAKEEFIRLVREMINCLHTGMCSQERLREARK